MRSKLGCKKGSPPAILIATTELSLQMLSMTFFQSSKRKSVGANLPKQCAHVKLHLSVMWRFTFFVNMVYLPSSTTNFVRHYANSNGCLSTFVISSKSTMILLQQCCRSFWYVNQALKRRLLFIVYHEMIKNDSAFLHCRYKSNQFRYWI